jgi:predicted dehydrogenase
MLDVGVVGVGHLGAHHARLYARMDGVRLVGVHDIDDERARTVAAEHGTRAVGGLDALIEQAQAVSVVVPTVSHREVAIPCLQAGVAVLLEKPMADSSAAAAEVLAVARRTGTPLMVGHIERWNGGFRGLEPHIGHARFIESHRLASFPGRGLDVDVILDLMIHDLDLVLAVARAPLCLVQAVGVSVLTGSADIANARLEFEDGLVANLTASRASREAVRKMRIFQDDAYLSCDFLRKSAEIYKRRPGAEAMLGEAARSSGRAGVPLTTILAAIEHQAVGPVEEPEPLAAELAAFVEAVASGRPPRPDGEAGLAAVALAERVKASMAEAAQRMGVDVADDGAALPAVPESPA